MDKIKKKRSVIVAFIKESKLIRTIAIIIGAIFIVLADFWITKFELSFEKKSDAVLMWIINIFIFIIAFLIIYAIKTVCEAIIYLFMNIIAPYIMSSIKQLRGIYNHCKMPLTIDEIHEFKSAEDYFTCIMDALYYGHDNYVKISREELRGIFSSCIKVFSSDSLFTMRHGIYDRLSFFIYVESDFDLFEQFNNFFDDYFELIYNDVTIYKRVVIEDDSSISFIAKTKDKKITCQI